MITACPEIWAPVRGTDGRLYPNICHAQNGGRPLDGVLDDLFGQAQQFVQGSVKQVRIKSAVTKDFVISTPLAPGAPTPPGQKPKTSAPSFKDKALRFIQPTIVLEHSLSSQPIIWAPYGVPAKTYYEWPIIAGAAIALLAGYGAFTGLKKLI